MSHITTQQLLNAHQLATAAWSQPSKLFTSGHDARTSDNSLLNLFYGGLVHAHQFNWQNAGRRLIDKTYIQMLMTSQGLSSLSFITAEKISANLDNFIKDLVVPDWQKINSKQHYEHQSELLHNLSIQVFNTDTSIVVASNLLFYLCPTQPFIPMTTGYLMALEELGFRSESNSYVHYSQAFSAAVTEHRSELISLAKPHSELISELENQRINQLIDDSKWWQNRLFIEILKQYILNKHSEKSTTLLGCNKTGSLT